MKTFIQSVVCGFTAASVMAGSVAAECTNDTWNKVMERGKIVIGVKADYKPWGYRDESGALVGMEVDMAMDVAATMGVEAELVPVQSSNRMQFLEQGKIDLMIATMSDREDRRKIVGIVGPELLHLRHQCHGAEGPRHQEAWEDLKDKPVCGKQGAFYNKIVDRALRRQGHRLHRQRRSQAGPARQEMRGLGL